MNNKRLLGAAALLLCAAMIKIRQRRRFKVRPPNRKRYTQNQFFYFKKIKAVDQEQFFKYTRMSPALFHRLLSAIESKIAKGSSSYGISSEQRLAVTLQYLVQGGTVQSLAWSYHMGLTTANKIIHETCDAIWDILSPIYLRNPSTETDWKEISKEFFDKWNFPNCLGAIEGKHIAFQIPPHNESEFINYTKHFSIILMAACDTNYRFTFVNIGACATKNDEGVFKNSVFDANLENKSMGIPPIEEIPNTTINVPYMFVADEAFPLHDHIITPYPERNLSPPQKIFNYRLSRARGLIENTFGILVARWQVLKQTINANVDNGGSIVKACVVLHNYCQVESRTSDGSIYCPPGYVDGDVQESGEWRTEVEQPLQSVDRLPSSKNTARISYHLQDTLAQYFMSTAGQLSWQLERVITEKEAELYK